MQTGQTNFQRLHFSDFGTHLQGKGVYALVSLFNTYWILLGNPNKFLPMEFPEIIRLLKKGSATDPANYRRISLLQICYKLHARVLASRLSNGLDGDMRPWQFGFCKGRSSAMFSRFGRRKGNGIFFLMFFGVPNHAWPYNGN